MTTISIGISNASSSQWGAQSHRVQRSGEGGQKGPSLDELFSKIDTDGNGGISAGELKAALQPPDGQGSSGGGSTSGASSSGSGSDTSANSLSGMGLGTQAFAAMMGGGMRPPHPAGGHGGHGGAGGPGGAGGAGGAGGGMPSLSSLDSDDDGSISQAEFGLTDSSSSSTSTTSSTTSVSSTQDDQQALFKLIDGDGDGGLSKTEVSSFEQKMRSLFATMQQMGQQAMGASGSTGSSYGLSASNAVSLTA